MATRRPSLLSLLATLTGWALLSLLLALQLRVATSGGFRVPEFALRFGQRQLLARGLDVRADSIWLDVGGRVLVHQPRLGLPGHAESIASARAVAFRLDWSALWSGAAALHRADVSDLALRVPASLTLDSTTRELLAGGEFRLARTSARSPWLMEQASARVLGVPTAFLGRLPASAAATPAPAHTATGSDVERNLRPLLDRIVTWHDLLVLFPLADLRVLRIELAPDRLELGGEADRVVWPAHPRLPASLAGAELENVAVRAELNLAGSVRTSADQARLQATRVHVPAAALEISDARLRLVNEDGYRAELAITALTSGLAPAALPPTPLVAAARLAADATHLDADFSVRLADSAWHFSADGAPRALSGQIAAEGRLTPALLEIARPLLPPPARPILEIADPVALRLNAEFGEGGRPVAASASLRSGQAVAGKVPFDRAAGSARYTFADQLLHAHDLVLVQGDSQAAGSYEMDARTLAFRFLLSGTLRPMGIEGWFSGWWDRLWYDFQFGPLPPSAEVDIQGVWKQPDLTRLFVGAASGPMRLRALELDHLHTRLWIEHDLVDVLGFHAETGPHYARGSFARREESPAAAWTRLRFDVVSTYPLDALPRLFPGEGEALVAPFALNAPPRLKLQGEARGPGAPMAAAPSSFRLELSTDQPLTYQDFPLERLSVVAHSTEDTLQLKNLRAGFAGGDVTGGIVLSGPPADRWVAFDLKLQNADLDETQAAWRTFQSARGEKVAPAKPLGGTLDATLVATGPLNDPLGYSGAGTGRVAGADLAAIRLLGPFSSMLAQAGLGIGTVRLHSADARFNLAGRRLDFESLEIAGDSAQVHAQGTYDLPAETIDFTAKLRPFQNQGGLLSSTADLVLAPLSTVLSVHLTGTLDKPSWRFNYGPRQWLRRITDR